MLGVLYGAQPQNDQDAANGMVRQGRGATTTTSGVASWTVTATSARRVTVASAVAAPTSPARDPRPDAGGPGGTAQGQKAETEGGAAPRGVSGLPPHVSHTAVPSTQPAAAPPPPCHRSENARRRARSGGQLGKARPNPTPRSVHAPSPLGRSAGVPVKRRSLSLMA
jgi:hypothetical protein